MSTITAIEAMGRQVYAKPLLQVRYMFEDLDRLKADMRKEAVFQAVIFTSQNAVEAFHEWSTKYSTPYGIVEGQAIAVGKATAQGLSKFWKGEIVIAEGAAFSIYAICVERKYNGPLSKLASGSQVLGAYGTEDRSVLDIHEDTSTGATPQLAAEVEFRKRYQGQLLYVRGKDIALDLPALLKEAGFDVQQAIVYKTLELLDLTAEAKTFIENEVSDILLYSAKTAITLEKLRIKHEVDLRGVHVVCLSKKIAAKVTASAYQDVCFCEYPSEEEALTRISPMP
jgi:uroporphyrinogen-III synthase